MKIKSPESQNFGQEKMIFFYYWCSLCALMRISKSRRMAIPSTNGHSQLWEPLLGDRGFFCRSGGRPLMSAKKDMCPKCKWEDPIWLGQIPKYNGHLGVDVSLILVLSWDISMFASTGLNEKLKKIFKCCAASVKLCAPPTNKLPPTVFDKPIYK